MTNVLAYDFGTGGIKASVYQPDGECLASHVATYETYYPKPGWHEQDPQAWWDATVEATRLLLDEWGGSPESIAAIGLSGHSLGVVPLDADGKLLRKHALIWSDSRPDTQPAQFFKTVAEEQWYLTTGNGFPAPLYTVFKIMWLRDNEPDVFGGIHKVLGSKDYINFRMTGVTATDYSYASGSGVWDLVNWKYSDGLVGASKLNGSIFPEAVASSDVIGTLTAEAAEQLGLPASVKVVAGGVDNSCMALGARAFRDGDVYNSMGSSSWIAVTDSKPLLDVGVRSYVFAHIVPGKFTSALGVFSTGSSFRWMREQLCTNYDAQADSDGCSTYDVMVARAAESELGANGCMFLPHLAGGSSLEPSQNIRGSFVHIDLGTTQADLCRAAMEGITMAQAIAMRHLESLAPFSDEILAVGGGSQSDLWMQMYADMYGKSVLRSQVGQQAAALGAAAAAFVGTGLWDDYSPIGSIHTITDTKSPIPANTAAYEKRRAIFEKLNGYLSDVGDDIAGLA
ncbi:MAG: xylulokinase [Planctomycetota bacterium]|jgi:xylulokinase